MDAYTLLNNGSMSPYGLGWGTAAVNGHRLIAHGGAHVTGFTSNLSYYRDDALTVIVLTNASHANLRTDRPSHCGPLCSGPHAGAVNCRSLK